MEVGLHDLEQPDVSLADEWSYCNTDLHPEHRQMSQLAAIKNYLTGKEPLLQSGQGMRPSQPGSLRVQAGSPRQQPLAEGSQRLASHVEAARLAGKRAVDPHFPASQTASECREEAPDSSP
uniref:Uncharacterized protein n=1 Tax=Sphaerodactylus townsendi TaxID=933632 RepID=A0ACB8EH93_9SAUR